MIIDSIENADKYSAAHPLFAKAFDFIRNASNLQNGKYEIDGDNMFAMISDNDLREDGELEAHKKYIDIQVVLSGTEIFRCSPVSKCKNISKSYDDRSDILFYKDKPTIEYVANEGMMSIFFPQDAHAPLIGNGKVHKIIIKVKA